MSTGPEGTELAAHGFVFRFPPDVTPEQVAAFEAEFDAALARGPRVPLVRWLPPDPRPLMVLHYRWTEDGTQRQETYGPWAVLDDESHLASVRDFINDWRRLFGCEPSEITMALLADPGKALRERAPQQG